VSNLKSSVLGLINKLEAIHITQEAKTPKSDIPEIKI